MINQMEKSIGRKGKTDPGSVWSIFISDALLYLRFELC